MEAKASEIRLTPYALALTGVKLKGTDVHLTPYAIELMRRAEMRRATGYHRELTLYEEEPSWWFRRDWAGPVGAFERIQFQFHGKYRE